MSRRLFFPGALTLRYLLAGTLLLALANAALASDYLLYWEAQFVGGYSSAAEEPIFYSMTQEEIMQKPSVGFDYLGRFSGEDGDFASAALQIRLAWNAEGEDRWEPQVYNAYVKLKAYWSDIWLGHNRPAMGLSSYFDSHGLLLRTLAMQGFGFDRDWGGGVYRDFSWGNVAASLTTGSGAPIYDRGNYMASVRASYGVLVRDNFNVGISGGVGETLETMGYELLNSEPMRMELGGADLTWLRDNLEHRLEFLAGMLWDEPAYALFYRLGIILDGEGKWKVEAQPTWLRQAGSSNRQLAISISNQLTDDLTVRTEYAYDDREEDHRVLLQLYYYGLY